MKCIIYNKNKIDLKLLYKFNNLIEFINFLNINIKS